MSPRCLGTSGSVRATRIAPPGVVGHGGPHLLPVDDPLVAVPDRAGRERRQVGPGAGLAEELAPDLLARPQRAQEPLPLLVGAEHQDRRRRHSQPDRCTPGVGCAASASSAPRRSAARGQRRARPAPRGSAPRPARRRTGLAGTRAGRRRGRARRGTRLTRSWRSGTESASFTRRSSGAGSRPWPGRFLCTSSGPSANLSVRRPPRGPPAGSPGDDRRRRGPGWPCPGSTPRRAGWRS